MTPPSRSAPEEIATSLLSFLSGWQLRQAVNPAVGPGLNFSVPLQDVEFAIIISASFVFTTSVAVANRFPRVGLVSQGQATYNFNENTAQAGSLTQFYTFGLGVGSNGGPADSLRFVQLPFLPVWHPTFVALQVTNLDAADALTLVELNYAVKR